MTLVVSCSAVASPHSNAPESDTETATEQDSKPVETLEEQGFIVTQPPSQETQKQETVYYYPYRQSMAPRFGLFIDPDELKDEGLEYFLGITYLQPRLRQPQLEYSADMVSNSTGLISAAFRWTLYATNSFRPFFKAGLTHHWISEERLASLSNFENYYVRGSAGLEDLLKAPVSVRLEFELLVGTEGFLSLLSLGYSWGW